MTIVQKLKEAIDQSAARWERSADAIEAYFDSSLDQVADRLEGAKERAAKENEKLKGAIEKSADFSSEATQKIAANLDHLRVQLALGKAEARDAVQDQQKKIAEAIDRVEDSVNEAGGKIGDEANEAIKKWVETQHDVREQFELASLRFDHEMSERKAQLSQTQQDLQAKLGAFRQDLKEKRSAAAEKGSAFAKDMGAALDKVKSAFGKLGS